jgi:hypothetical protein
MGQNERVLWAYELYNETDMPLASGALDRDWMDASPQRFAYRCLPLTIANQAGWKIDSPATFCACWNGGPNPGDVTLTFAGPADVRVVSHFGCGVVTFTLPYLFRTPNGVNLWVKGLSNWIKDGAQALEGVVETDWMPSTFTMNWKLTRPNYPVRFERGEPVCMVVPVTRGLAEGLTPRLARLEESPDLKAQYDAWNGERDAFIRALRQREPGAVARGWQRDYMKGLLPDGARAAEHQTRVSLREFRREAAQETRPVPYPQDSARSDLAATASGPGPASGSR